MKEDVYEEKCKNIIYDHDLMQFLKRDSDSKKYSVCGWKDKVLHQQLLICAYNWLMMVKLNHLLPFTHNAINKIIYFVAIPNITILTSHGATGHTLIRMQKKSLRHIYCCLWILVRTSLQSSMWYPVG
jgi:hypothetical protein